MAGRKLTRIQPQETPPGAVPVFDPKYVAESAPVPRPEPVTKEMVAEAVPQWTSLRQGTWALCGLWDRADAQLRKILQPSMMELLHSIRAAALENGGYGKSRGEARDIFKAKYAYITGRTYKYGQDQCVAITKGGTRCKNNALIGETRCHTPGHASDEERKRAWERTQKWQEHFGLMVTNIGCSDAYMALSERITHTRDL